MKRVGNAASNRLFNPRNVKPAIPVDVDEVDGVMERFIRQKYEHKTLSSQPSSSHPQYTANTTPDDRTSQLPPKPTKRFTFSLRSTSSTLPLPRQENSPPVSPRIDGSSLSRIRSKASPQRKSKPAKIFGADIGGSRADNYELKLIALKEMGFPDDKRNLTILKGENGNIDRAVATLIRLGEGSRVSSGRSSPVPETPPKDDDYIPAITVDKNLKPNPFDRLDLQDKALPPPPVEEHALHSENAALNGHSYNPFLQSSQATLEQNFRSLQVSQPSQLFPNTTGGHMQHSQPANTNPFLQTYTPPPQLTHSGPFAAPVPFAPPMASDSIQAPLSVTNPFLRKSPSQPFQSINPFSTQVIQPSSGNWDSNAIQFNYNQAVTPQTQAATQYSNFHANTTTMAQNPFHSTGPRQPSPSNPFHASTFPLSSQPNPTQAAPFTANDIAQPTVYTSQSQNFFPGNTFSSSSQAQNPQSLQSARLDKASILALYNLSPASTPSTQQDPNTTSGPWSHPSAQQAAPENSSQGHVPQPHPGSDIHLGVTRRSVTMPLPSTSHSPFVQSTPVAVPSNDLPALPQSHQIQKLRSTQVPSGPRPGHESADFTAAAAFLNGRHSPDMFAGLSARMR
jgi:hypothetical protein